MAKSNSDKLQEYLDGQKVRLAINPKDLQAAFVAQPQGYYDVAMRFEKAERIVSQQKTLLDKVKADTGHALRQSGEKVTEAYVAECIAIDDDVIRQRNLVSGAIYQAGCYKQLMKAWEHRRDMLIQLGSTWRAEFNAGVQINRDDGPADDVGPKSERTGRRRNRVSKEASKFQPGIQE